ncbi:MAG TPA: hypothetical protein VKT75_09275, partial [Acidobacteriaceae bacterium]|nr:hypothetical protein [Acidobacteriaceae bacterium]
TVFRLLHLPPLNLFDAAAADLGDCFTSQPDFTPFHAAEPDKRIFDPAFFESRAPRAVGDSLPNGGRGR